MPATTAPDMESSSLCARRQVARPPYTRRTKRVVSASEHFEAARSVNARAATSVDRRLILRGRGSTPAAVAAAADGPSDTRRQGDPNHGRKQPASHACCLGHGARILSKPPTPFVSAPARVCRPESVLIRQASAPPPRGRRTAAGASSRSGVGYRQIRSDRGCPTGRNAVPLAEPSEQQKRDRPRAIRPAA
jgi:hypothetical protein